MNLSIVVPMKDEKDNVERLHEAITRALDGTGYEYEAIVVDDGSTDGTFEALAKVGAKDHRFKVIQLRRNFGQTPALRAGIDAAQGDVIVTMDGDLQNDPSDIPMMLEKLKEGYDVVLGERVNRQDKLVVRKIPSWTANALIRQVTGTKVRDLGCTLRVMRREAALELPLYGEMHRFMSVLSEISGQRIYQMPVKHHARQFGKTKYNLSRTVRVVLDLITVRFLQSYLTRPMHIFGLTGLGCFGLSFAFLMTCVVQRLAWNERMNRNPLLLLSVLLTVVGVQFISLGLIGEVLSRTYFESQGKAPYHIRRTLNLDNDVIQATLGLEKKVA
ncbi:MAG: glycosyltransferase family 2 protein [Planctomycetia bacterium]|nr:glycosyltransferase family 2 protein [Planctomycetia bacterium]